MPLGGSAAADAAATDSAGGPWYPSLPVQVAPSSPSTARFVVVRVPDVGVIKDLNFERENLRAGF